MHIAFLTTEYVTEPSFDGGLANYLQRIALSMLSRGHQVEIFVRAPNNEIFNHQGVIIHRVKMMSSVSRVLKKLLRGKFGASLNIMLFGWAARRSLLRRHRYQPFDVVQAASYLASGIGLSHLSPVPMVVRVSSYGPFTRRENHIDQRPSSDTVLKDFLEKHALKHAAGVYAPSSLLANIILQETGVKASVVRPPFFIETTDVDETIYKQSLGNMPYLLYYGAVNRLKGCVVLANALSRAFQRHPDLHFVIAGKVQMMPDGKSYLDHILETAGDNANRVHYIGRLPHSQLYPVIRGATGVVLPSLIDNLPNTCLEAMSQGRVIIGTNGTSFEELIESDISGLLVPPSDEHALLEAMSRLWTMPNSERERMGSEAKAKLQRDFSPETTCQSLEEWFNPFIKCKGSSVENA
ncbi:MAG: glycosyltransferase family 4 protein [Anaerolinea sp.]|nr:glycosyltransferase family 4 protein [Anaerolinea sp.]